MKQVMRGKEPTYRPDSIIGCTFIHQPVMVPVVASRLCIHCVEASGVELKIFISWSGSRSKALAIALRDWLPLVLQYAKPWVSDKDIGAGDRWAQSIAGELETSNFGIICITPENLQSEWILFEAGALSKSMLDAKVIPLLFGLELSDLSGPLSQFQAQKVEESGVMEVVRAINKVADGQTSDHIVSRLVPQL